MADSAAMQSDATTSPPRSYRATWLAGVLVIALIVLAGITNHAVEESLDDILSSSLTTVLDTEVTAVSLWLDAETDEVKAWAQSDTVVTATGELIDLSRTNPHPAAFAIHPAAQRLQEHLQPRNIERQMFAITDRSGHIIAARRATLLGQEVSPELLALMSAGLEHDSFVVPPLVAKQALRADVEELDYPVMFVAAAIRDNDHVLGVLWFRIDPLDEFSEILARGRMGASGESFAFSADGLLLTPSRFEDQLIDSELLDALPTTSVLQVRLRDPGGDLTAGHRPDTPTEEQPLTRMVAAAVTGRDGLDLDGYRSYRGIAVVGAWRWLDQLGFGVGIEIAEREAKSLLRPLRRAAWALFAFLAVSVVVILLSVLRIARLKQDIDEVKRLGQYTLVDKIGAGGMGTVYRARHAMLQRPTAIKLLRGQQVSADDIARFEREVQLTSELTHPNTIEVYDFGRNHDGIFYYAMELIDGLTLADLIAEQGPQPPGRVIHILRQVCGSLVEAHGIGLIHRDIKPPNIMVCQRGGQYDVAKVLDFGLVKSIAGRDAHVTAEDIVAGTPAYIPPERLMDPQAVDARTDLYALGGVAFNLLTARDVFEGETAMVVCQQALHTPAPRASDHSPATVPRALDDLIASCLSKEPENRPASALAMLEALEAIASAHPWSRDDARRYQDGVDARSQQD